LQAYLSLPLRYVGDNILTWRGSYDVSGRREDEMNGPKVNPRKSLCLRLKRPRSNPDQLMPIVLCCGSYGDPVLEWRRPGGSVSAIMRQG
jgi:hypothetical protein